MHNTAATSHSRREQAHMNWGARMNVQINWIRNEIHASNIERLTIGRLIATSAIIRTSGLA
jgi:hypothetical protein